MTAEDSLRLLLAFYQEAQPGPRPQRLADTEGGRNSERGPCPDCAGKGEHRIRRLRPGVEVWRNDAGHFMTRCARCAGRGWLELDTYTGQEVGTEETGTAPAVHRATCDSCGGAGVHGNTKRCRYCHGSGSVVIPSTIRGERKPTRRDRERETQQEILRATRASGAAGLWTAGSFPALEVALAKLSPWARVKVWRTYVMRELAEDDASRELLHILTVLVRHLEHGRIRVPSEIRRWAEGLKQPAARLSVGERNEAMRRARAEGETLSAIARRFGVSKSTAGRVTG